MLIYTSNKCPLLSQISKKQHDLKKKLKVTFAGEPGLDMGGLTKEWFLLLIKKIFHENYGNYLFIVMKYGNLQHILIKYSN